MSRSPCAASGRLDVCLRGWNACAGRLTDSFSSEGFAARACSYCARGLVPVLGNLGSLALLVELFGGLPVPCP